MWKLKPERMQQGKTFNVMNLFRKLQNLGTKEYLEMGIYYLSSRPRKHLHPKSH